MLGAPTLFKPYRVIYHAAENQVIIYLIVRY